jgi:Na+-driven multidrug efflux pump
LRWGGGAGVVLGLLVLGSAHWLPGLFSRDPTVVALLTSSLLLVAAHQPVAGPVFVLDGVLIGAGDARWLAGAGVVMLVAFLPAAWLVERSGTGVVGLWWALLWFMLVRLAALSWRAGSSAWRRTGA